MAQTVISSASKEVVIGFGHPFVMIGERINPTGRKLLAEEMKNDDFSRWVSELRLRKHACCAVVAVAHKIARLMWILLQKQEAYQPQYQKAITC